MFHLQGHDSRGRGTRSGLERDPVDSRRHAATLAVAAVPRGFPAATALEHTRPQRAQRATRDVDDRERAVLAFRTVEATLVADSRRAMEIERIRAEQLDAERRPS